MPSAPKHKKPKWVCIGTVNVWAIETHDTSEHPYEDDGNPIEVTLSDLHDMELEVNGKRIVIERPGLPLGASHRG